MEKRVILSVLCSILILGIGFSQDVFAETVFEEKFDTPLVGWSESICNRNTPANQICSIGQAPTLHTPPFESPSSLPTWGYVQIAATPPGNDNVPVEIRYEKSFTVTTPDTYSVESFVGIMDCGNCVISSQLFIDGIPVISKSGVDTAVEPALNSHKTFETTTIPLLAGPHTVEIAMHSTGAISGDFRASFDDIKIFTDTPTLPPLTCGVNTIQVNNECIPDLNAVCGAGTFISGLQCIGLGMQAIGGMDIQINTLAVMAAGVGVDPLITGLVVITMVGITGQVAWFVHRRNKQKD